MAGELRPPYICVMETERIPLGVRFFGYPKVVWEYPRFSHKDCGLFVGDLFCSQEKNRSHFSDSGKIYEKKASI